MQRMRNATQRARAGGSGRWRVFQFLPLNNVADNARDAEAVFRVNRNRSAK
jgi:hypothetical protein